MSVCCVCHTTDLKFDLVSTLKVPFTVWPGQGLNPMALGAKEISLNHSTLCLHIPKW